MKKVNNTFKKDCNYTMTMLWAKNHYILQDWQILEV